MTEANNPPESSDAAASTPSQPDGATDGMTPAWVVNPVGPLTGDIVVRGSKNAVTKHLVASMLGDSPSTITNCPDIGDVDITTQMLAALGCGIDRDDGIAAVDPSTLSSSRVPLTFSGMNRIPILMVGPLLHKLGEAFVPLVGGDDIGSRPVDFHVDALQAMGAEISFSSEGLEAKAGRLRGAHITLPLPRRSAPPRRSCCRPPWPKAGRCSTTGPSSPR